MGIVVRQSLKSAIVTIAGAALGGVVMLTSVALFGKQNYGFQQSLQKYGLMLCYFCMLGFNNAVIVLGQKYEAGHPGRGYFLKITFMVPLIVSATVSVAMLLFKQQVLSVFQEQDYFLMERYFLCFPLYMMANILMMWLESYLMSIYKTALQNFMREILLRMINMVLLGLFFAGIIDFDLYISLFVGLHIIPLFALWWVARKHEGFYFNGPASSLSIAERKEVFRFSIYHMLGVVSTVLIFQVDALLIPPLSANGLEDAAVYATAIFAISLMRNPVRVISTVTIPAFSQAYNAGRIKELRELYFRSSVNMQVIAMIMFLVIAPNLGNAVRLLDIVKPGYAMVSPLILVLMIGQLIEMGVGPSFELLGVTKYYRFNFWIAVGLLAVIILLNILLITNFGLMGAAWAMTIGLILFNLAKSIFLWRKLKIQPFGMPGLKILGIGIVVYLVGMAIPYLGNIYLDVSLRTFTILALLWVLLYKAKVSAELNGVTHNLITRRRLF